MFWSPSPALLPSPSTCSSVSSQFSVSMATTWRNERQHRIPCVWTRVTFSHQHLLLTFIVIFCCFCFLKLGELYCRWRRRKYSLRVLVGSRQQASESPHFDFSLPCVYVVRTWCIVYIYKCVFIYNIEDTHMTGTPNRACAAHAQCAGVMKQHTRQLWFAVHWRNKVVLFSFPYMN